MVSAQVSLPLSNYKFKFNQPSGAFSIEVTQWLDMACGWNPTWTCFFCKRVFVFFQTFFRLFIFAGLVAVAALGPIFFEGSGFFEIVITPMLETKPGSSIPVKTCFFFCKIKIYRFFLYRFFLIALLSNSLKAPCQVFVVIFIDKKFSSKFLFLFI